jgi:hypothetical protein
MGAGAQEEANTEPTAERDWREARGVPPPPEVAAERRRIEAQGRQVKVDQALNGDRPADARTAPTQAAAQKRHHGKGPTDGQLVEARRLGTIEAVRQQFGIGEETARRWLRWSTEPEVLALAAALPPSAPQAAAG